jgi:hypothetical protein
VVAQGQWVVGDRPRLQRLLENLFGLLRFSEVIGEEGPDERVPGDTGESDRGLVGVGDEATGLMDNTESRPASIIDRESPAACLSWLRSWWIAE